MTSILADITLAGRLKYIEASYLNQATATQLKREIQHLIDAGKISKEIIKIKTGNKYSTFIYLSLK